MIMPEFDQMIPIFPGRLLSWKQTLRSCCFGSWVKHVMFDVSHCRCHCHADARRPFFVAPHNPNGCAKPALQGMRDVGTGRTGECAPTSKRQVLQVLYRSETWVLSTATLARLEGFHLRAAYRMSRKYVPRRGSQHQWVYPPLDKVLEECGMHTIQHYRLGVAHPFLMLKAFF